MKVKRQIEIQGWDLSPNHAGIVRLVNGVMRDYYFVTDDKKSHRHDSEHSSLIEYPPGIEKEMKQYYRMDWWKKFTRRFLEQTKPVYVVIEDYAMHATGKMTLIAEVCGIVKLEVLKASCKLRLHDPTTLKLFAARNGAADKTQMERAIDERWGVDFDEVNVPDRKSRVVSEDLADAFALAQFVHLELQLRRAEIELKTLPVEDIRCFNRVTKANPTNILDRDFLQWGES